MFSQENNKEKFSLSKYVVTKFINLTLQLGNEKILKYLSIFKTNTTYTLILTNCKAIFRKSDFSNTGHYNLNEQESVHFIHEHIISRI